MYEKKRQQQGDVIEEFLEELFERGETEDEVFQLLTDKPEFKGELPIQWVFEHQPTAETLYFLIDSEDPLSTMGVRISDRDASSLNFKEQIVLKILWVNEMEGSLEKASSIDLRSLKGLSENDQREELQRLFEEADQVVRKKDKS